MLVAATGAVGGCAVGGLLGCFSFLGRWLKDLGGDCYVFRVDDVLIKLPAALLPTSWFQRQARPVPNALRQVRRVLDEGHRVVFVTAFDRDVEDMVRSMLAFALDVQPADLDVRCRPAAGDVDAATFNMVFATLADARPDLYVGAGAPDRSAAMCVGVSVSLNPAGGDPLQNSEPKVAGSVDAAADGRPAADVTPGVLA